MATELKVITYIFYMLLIVVWIQGVYLTALKDYKKIIKSYVIGNLLSLALAFTVLKTGILPAIFGVLLAMSIGILVIAIMLMINIKKFFIKSSCKNFLFLDYVESHFSLFLINLFYTIGIYVANIIMWQGPLAVHVADTYVYAPIYDVATFYAFLSILPVMAIFVISTELNFYNKYTTYFTYVTEKGNYKEIEHARKDLLNVMWSELRNTVEIQLVYTLVFLAMGNYLLPKIGITHASVNMFNLIVLGAYAVGVMQIITTILLYLEDRKGVLAIVLCFLLTNVTFNLISLRLGENTYGFGIFLAAFLSLAISLQRLSYYGKRLDYFVFCSRPVLYNMKPGILAKLAGRLYN